MPKRILATLAILGIAHTLPGATVLPLEENNWDNPGFVSRFLGSYGFDTERTPEISSSEGELFQQLATLMESQNLDEAIQLLQRAITPESSAALNYTLGNILFQQGRNAEAISAYQAALKKFPNFVRAKKNLGILLIQQAQYKEALTYLLDTARNGSFDGSTLGLVAYAYLNLGQNQSALDAYRLAVILDPDSRDWKMGKAQALLNVGLNREAIALLEEMINDASDPADLLMLQANAFLGDDRPMEAAANLEVVDQMGKANATSLVLLGDIFVNDGNPDIAASYYLKAMDQDGLDVERIIRAISILASTEAWEPADQLINKAMEERGELLSPSREAELLNLQAQVALGKNEDARAAEILENLVSVDPLNGQALLTLGNYYWKQGELERAELSFDRAKTVDSVAADAYVQHARLRVEQRDYSEAVGLLEQAQSIRPRSNIANYLASVASAAASTR